MVKDPQARLDYVWDWTAWLGDDTITAATVTAPTGITVEPAEHDGQKVTAWISGGDVGHSYEATCHITTTAGRVDDRTISLDVRQR